MYDFTGIDRPFKERGERRLLSLQFDELESRLLFKFNFKGTPSQEEHKIISSRLF
jgi:hypothetical protein